MSTWSVLYWEDERPVWRWHDTFAWEELPQENVLWVDVWDAGYHQCLGGMDNYWLTGNLFGLFNDPENADWYSGRQAIAYRWTGTGSEEIEPNAPPGVHVLRGVMLPDDLWDEVVREYTWRP